VNARDDSASADSRRQNLLLMVILALALVLRLPNFNESLWHDELWSTLLKLDTLRGLMFEIATDSHPPFFNVVMFVWVRLFGDSEISVRMLPLICGLLTIALTARLAGEYGSARAGAVAALILAISPPHIWYSQEARQYAPLVLMLMACTWAFHRFREPNATRWYVAYAALALCMVLTHYFALAYVGAFTVLAMPDRRIRRRMLWIAVVTASVIGVYLAIRWRLNVLPTRLGHLRGFGFVQAWSLFFDWYVIGGAFGFPDRRGISTNLGILAIQLTLFALVVRGVYRAAAASTPTESSLGRWDAFGRRWELAILLLILPLALFTLGLIGAKHFYIERSAITGLPFFAIAVGIGATSFRSRRWRVASVALIAGFGAVVLANYYARSDRRTVFIANPDWRTAAQWLRRQHKLTEPPAVIMSITPAVELLYYDHDLRLIDAPRGPTSRVFATDKQNAESLRERLKRRFSPPVDTLRGRSGRIYTLGWPDVSQVKSVLDREQASEFFVVTNRRIVNKDRLRDAIAADSSFAIDSVFEPKGLRLLRVRRVSGGPQGG
jgi:4-amino-4-deoxy-L-arabinose transferase-like glycosyltransferase